MRGQFDIGRRFDAGAFLPVATAALLMLGACSSPTSSGGQGTVDGTVFLWVGADKDTYVSCGQAGPPCPEENLSFGTHGNLVVARNGVALKKSYVHFGLPILPSGTAVEEAYLELFHPGQNEDGQTDDVNIPVGRAAASWSPHTMTFATEPNPQLTGAETSINLNSMEWSGTPNIVGIVNDWYDDPSSNHGFYIFYAVQTPPIEKGFYSINDIRRTVDDLGLSPRLLLKVQLPDGQSTDDIQLPPLPADNDIDFDGQQVLMVRFNGGDDWPDSWGVRLGT